MDYITVVRSDKAINKKFSIKDKKVIKQKALAITKAIAYTAHVPDQTEMLKLLQTISNDPNSIFILGYIPAMLPVGGASEGQEFVLMKEDDIKGRTMVDGLPVYARTKANFKPSTWFLLDHDLTPDTPVDLQYENMVQVIDAYHELIPSLSGYLAMPSNSSRVMFNGKPYNVGSNLHLYVQAKDADDVDRFGKALLVHADSIGFGYLRMRRSSTTGEVVGQVPWAIFDPTVFSRERLIYEGKPTARGKGLSISPVDIVIENGNKLDTHTISSPTSKSMQAFKDRTGITLKKGTTLGWHWLQDMDIQTEVDTVDHGVMTVEDYWVSERGKLRAQSPFRDSSSEAAFLNRHSNGSPFLWDAGTKYLPLGSPAISKLIDAAKAIPVEEWGARLEPILRTVKQSANAIETELALKELKKHSGLPIGVLRDMIKDIAVQEDIEYIGAEWVEDWNRRFALVYMGSDVRIATWRRDGGIKFLKTKAFKEFMKSEKGNDDQPLAQLWMEHSDCRKYHDVEFKPRLSFAEDFEGFNAGGVLNLWTGYRLKPKKGNWALIGSHLREVWCGGDNATYEWLLDYLAYKLQNPHEVGQVIIVLRSIPGAGKGIIIHRMLIDQIIGKVHGIRVTQGKHLTGSFNAHLKDKILVFADEVVYGGAKAEASALKGMTDGIQGIERKGIDLELTEDSSQMVMAASNGDYPVSIDFGDRRMAILPISDKYAGNKKHFDKLAGEIYGDGSAAFFDAMLARDVSAYKPNVMPPLHSDLRVTLQLKSSAPGDRFLFTLFDEGDPKSLAHVFDNHESETPFLGYAERNFRETFGPDDGVDWTTHYAVFDKKRFYQAFLDTFGTNYSEKDGGGVFYQELKPKWRGIVYVTRRTWDKHVRGLVLLSPLPDCRREFEAVMKSKAWH